MTRTLSENINCYLVKLRKHLNVCGDCLETTWKHSGDQMETKMETNPGDKHGDSNGDSWRLKRLNGGKMFTFTW